MLMLCVDASTSHFGFALYEDGVLIKADGVYVKGTFDLAKLQEIYRKLQDKFHVDHVVFEQPAPIRFSKALTSINQVFGMLAGTCLERGITIDWLHNRTIKSRMGITMKGRDGKKQSIAIARAMYPTFVDDITTDHISDAILIGETYKLITM